MTGLILSAPLIYSNKRRLPGAPLASHPTLKYSHAVPPAVSYPRVQLLEEQVGDDGEVGGLGWVNGLEGGSNKVQLLLCLSGFFQVSDVFLLSPHFHLNISPFYSLHLEKHVSHICVLNSLK